MKKGRLSIDRGIAWGLTLAAVFSVHAVLEKSNIDNYTVDNQVFWVGLFATTFTWSIQPFSREPRDKLRNMITNKMVVISIITTVASGWGYVLTLEKLNVAVVNFISGLGVVATVIAGAVFLGERDNMKQKIISVVLAVIGLVFILLGQL